MSDYDNEIADHGNYPKAGWAKPKKACELIDTPSIDALRQKATLNPVEEVITDAYGMWANGTSQQCIERVRSVEDAALMVSRRWHGDTVCEVCWSSSWQPCEKGTPNAVEDKTTGGWMVCGFCNETELANNLRSELEKYKAFYDIHVNNPPLGASVEALKDVADRLIAENNRMKSALYQIQRIVPNLSAVDDLYSAIAEFGMNGEWCDASGIHHHLPEKKDFKI